MNRYFQLMEHEQIAALISYARQSGLLAALLKSKISTGNDLSGRKERAMSLMLSALVELGYATRDGSTFYASKELAKLSADASFNWSALPTFIESGEPWAKLDESLQATEKFYSDFFESVRYTQDLRTAADEIANQLPPSAEEILDVGAGTGVWSLAYAQLNKQARTTAVDLPRVLETSFMPNATRLGIQHRCTHVAGDFHEIRFAEAKYDMVILGSMVHFVKESKASKFFNSIAKALKPGGTLLIVGHFAAEDQQQRLSTALYALRLAMRTGDTKNYSQQEISDYCSQFGLNLNRTLKHHGPTFMAANLYSK